MKGFCSEIKDVGLGLVKLFSFKVVTLFALFILLNGISRPSIDEFETKYNFNVIHFTS